MKESLTPSQSKNVYNFGSDRQSSMGSIPVRVPINDDKVICVNVDVANAGVPFFLYLTSLNAIGA